MARIGSDVREKAANIPSHWNPSLPFVSLIIHRPQAMAFL
jgi:hypothetical protein